MDAHRMLDRVLDTGFAVAGIGLDSAEAGHPPSLFRAVFERARQAGLHTVAHAGEEGPPSYVIIELAIGEAREYNELLKRTYFD